MLDEKYLQQLGIGVASLTFGVALAIFIQAIISGLLNGLQAWLLFGATFLLMLRFWWRYTEVFIRFLPSRSYWHFLFDFAISLCGITAAMFVNNIQVWSLLGAFAMAASAVRCALSWKDAKSEEAMLILKKTLHGAVAMLVIMSIVYLLAPLADNVILAVSVFALVLIFVAYASRKS